MIVLEVHADDKNVNLILIIYVSKWHVMLQQQFIPYHHAIEVSSTSCSKRYLLAALAIRTAIRNNRQ